MKKILLNGKYSRNHYVLIDDDLELPKSKKFKDKRELKWQLSKNGYATININNRFVSMQNWIMNTPKGMDTDHINGNKLDNRKENLQIVSKSINQQRRKLQSNNKTGFRGVQWYKQTKRWRASIQFNNKNIHLGYYENIKDAILIYDEMAKKLFGKTAILNFQAR